MLTLVKMLDKMDRLSYLVENLEIAATDAVTKPFYVLVLNKDIETLRYLMNNSGFHKLLHNSVDFDIKIAMELVLLNRFNLSWEIERTSSSDEVDVSLFKTLFLYFNCRDTDKRDAICGSSCLRTACVNLRPGVLKCLAAIVQDDHRISLHCLGPDVFRYP